MEDGPIHELSPRAYTYSTQQAVVLRQTLQQEKLRDVYLVSDLLRQSGV